MQELFQTAAVTGHEHWLAWVRMFVTWFVNAVAIAITELVEVLRALLALLPSESR